MFLNLILLILAPNVFAMSRENLDGYPVGYLSDCPGSTKEAIITRRSLRRLTFSIHTSIGTARKKYNYFQMKTMAKDPNLDFRKMTMLYVGGFMDSPNFLISAAPALKYAELGYNVLLLDTLDFTAMEYPRAARFTRPVGKHVAKMLADLTNEGLDPKKLEIVAISLGGQTASFVGKNYQQLTKVNVSRITALDPSGPCFRHLGPEERLDKGDADFIDVIYTNIDGFGMATPVGHVNFYVNGGEYQPGSVHWAYCDILCSHIRSYFIWMSALHNPESFIGIKCDSVQEARDRGCFDKDPQVTNVLGLNTNKHDQGIFYLATTNVYPYYLNERGLKKENDFVLALTKSLNDENVISV